MYRTSVPYRSASSSNRSSSDRSSTSSAFNAPCFRLPRWSPVPGTDRHAERDHSRILMRALAGRSGAWLQQVELTGVVQARRTEAQVARLQTVNYS